MTKERSEISEKFKWAIENVYEDTEEWEEDFEKAKEEIQEFEEYEGQLTDSADKLLEFLELYSDVMRRISKLSRYASMKSDEDTRKQKYQALSARAGSLGSEASAATSFVEPEIQKLDQGELEEMFDDNSDLEKYDYYLEEILRMKPHTRSEEVENVLSNLSEVLDAPSDAYKMLSNADLKFPEVERDGEKVRITQANFTKLLKDKDRDFRREVYEKFYDTFSSVENTVGSTFSKNIRRNVKMAKVRNYDSAREAALDSSNIPGQVYDNLVGTVHDNLDVLHDHIELKREILGVDELGMHDVYMPVTESESPEIEYQEAREHILKAVEPLGDEYVKVIEKAFDNRWIDVYENEGKRSGAYSGGAYDTRPFILMNYQDDVSSMYTLAHELGHSVHSYYTRKNQPYLHSNYDIFVAEVASTVNEALLTRHLLETVEDEKFRRHVLSHSLENFRNTLFRQTMFADFEQRVHETVEEGGALTPESVSEMYHGLKEKFYKPANVDERIATEWMRIPHFYYKFYVFQYATGISAANALSKQIVEDGPMDYVGFLKKGGSDHPLELLKDAGVDMTYSWPVEEAISVYRDQLEKMKKLS